MNRVDVYPFIEAEKLNSHTDQDGHTTAPGSVIRQGNVKRACELLEVSRSAYYQHRVLQAAGGSARQRRDAELAEKIRTIHTGLWRHLRLPRGCTPSSPTPASAWAASGSPG